MPDDINAVLGIAEPTSTRTANFRSQHPAEFLGRVRQKTCYGFLRALITATSVIWIIVTIIFSLYCIVKGVGESNGLLFLGGVAGGILSVFGIVASQQASSLLIDIADTIIQQCWQKPIE